MSSFTEFNGYQLFNSEELCFVPELPQDSNPLFGGEKDPQLLLDEFLSEENKKPFSFVKEEPLDTILPKEEVMEEEEEEEDPNWQIDLQTLINDFDKKEPHPLTKTLAPSSSSTTSSRSPSPSSSSTVPRAQSVTAPTTSVPKVVNKSKILSHKWRELVEISVKGFNQQVRELSLDEATIHALKEERKRVKNREAAVRSRSKKEAMIDRLEGQVRLLLEENRRQKEIIEALKKKLPSE